MMFRLFKKKQKENTEGLPEVYESVIVTLKDGKKRRAYLEFNRSPYRYHDKKEYPDEYVWVIGRNIPFWRGRDVKLSDVKSWRYL